MTEALNIYQELQEKNKPSTLLLNGQAIALIALGRHAEAESLLRQALDIVSLPTLLSSLYYFTSLLCVYSYLSQFFIGFVKYLLPQILFIGVYYVI